MHRRERPGDVVEVLPVQRNRPAPRLASVFVEVLIVLVVWGLLGLVALPQVVWGLLRVRALPWVVWGLLRVVALA
jgi:hypothetical protein